MKVRMVVKLCRLNQNGVPAQMIMVLVIYIEGHLSPGSNFDRVVGLCCLLFCTALLSHSWCELYVCVQMNVHMYVSGHQLLEYHLHSTWSLW